MSTLQRVALGASAYSKMVLHCLRHPQNAVCGLLVGVEDVEAQRRTVTCTDAFPLLHSHFLHPQLRLGLELVEEFCRCADRGESAAQAHVQTEGSKGARGDFSVNVKSATLPKGGAEGTEGGGLRIVGFYYCETVENPQGPSASRLFNSIARVIAKKYPGLVVCSLWVFGEDGRWKAVNQDAVLVTAASKSLLKRAVQSASFSAIHDLDDHLADSSLSPVNETLLGDFADLVAKDEEQLRQCGVAFPASLVCASAEKS